MKIEGRGSDAKLKKNPDNFLKIFFFVESHMHAF